jgi:hypothetical protein
MLVKKEKAPGIWIYEECFDSSSFIELIEKEAEKTWGYLTWTSSSTGGQDRSVISDYRTSLEMVVTPLIESEVHESIQPIADEFMSIFSSIDKAIWDYRDCFDLHLKTHNGLQVLKYLDGGEYHHHYDHAPDNARVLSMVACLDDNFEGGELEFPFFDVKIKLSAGSVALFPSNFPYTHIAHPVTKGIKYSLVTWFV